MNFEPLKCNKAPKIPVMKRPLFLTVPLSPSTRTLSLIKNIISLAAANKLLLISQSRPRALFTGEPEAYAMLYGSQDKASSTLD